jgi:ketosteroid isomerase-like protein
MNARFNGFKATCAVLVATIGAGIASPTVAASSSPAAASTAADRDAVVATVTAMFEAAKQDDLAKFHTLATADFYAFDGGKRFDGDALMQLIKQLHAAGKVYEWHVTQPEVHIDGHTAWVTYVNRGSIQDASGKQDQTWLESVILRKQQGRWRVHFVHSTRVS